MRPAAALALVALLAAGCGDDEDASDATTSTSGEGTTTTAVPLPEEPPLIDDAESGSGCTPGADELPDGWWYGTVDGPVTSEVTFDLACYYLGAAAEAEASSRGDEVNNDYYVVNDNPQLRTIDVAGDATASCVRLGAGVETVDCSPAEVTGEWAVWLRVQDGEVDRIVEQYAP